MQGLHRVLLVPPRPVQLHGHRAVPSLERLAGQLLRRLLRGHGLGLAGVSEAHGGGRGPGLDVARLVAEREDDVVEGVADVDDALQRGGLLAAEEAGDLAGPVADVGAGGGGWGGGGSSITAAAAAAIRAG